MRDVPFSADELSSIRRQVLKGTKWPRDWPNGWTICPVDPIGVLDAFPTFRIRDGFVLRAYEYRNGGNGNGLVFAFPAGREVPEPDACRPAPPETPCDYFPEPAPPGALDPMAVVEGDDSARSYLLASILGRELREFGAAWHGNDWKTHRIIDSNPAPEQPPDPQDRSLPDLHAPRTPVADWKWRQPEPEDWRPVVEYGDEAVKVQFLTFSGVATERIYRYTDSYRRGCYEFETAEETMAMGTFGYLF